MTAEESRRPPRDRRVLVGSLLCSAALTGAALAVVLLVARVGPGAVGFAAFILVFTVLTHLHLAHYRWLVGLPLSVIPALLLLLGTGDADQPAGQAVGLVLTGGLLGLGTLALCTWAGNRWGPPRYGPVRRLLRELVAGGP